MAEMNSADSTVAAMAKEKEKEDAKEKAKEKETTGTHARAGTHALKGDWASSIIFGPTRCVPRKESRPETPTKDRQLRFSGHQGELSSTPKKKTENT